MGGRIKWLGLPCLSHTFTEGEGRVAQKVNSLKFCMPVPLVLCQWTVIKTDKKIILLSKQKRLPTSDLNIWLETNKEIQAVVYNMSSGNDFISNTFGISNLVKNFRFIAFLILTLYFHLVECCVIVVIR